MDVKDDAIPPPTCQKAIGALIRQIRTEQGYTQVSLSAQTKYDQRTISGIECGDFTHLNIDALHEICLALDTTPSEFLDSLDARFDAARKARSEQPRRSRRQLAQVAS